MIKIVRKAYNKNNNTKRKYIKIHKIIIYGNLIMSFFDFTV